ncbi:MAG: FAD-binding oxidoreductase [Alphaproteobacteria bacterium]|nr:FAD-binding oxidoreductase [Alphaproteobacteria bacterium]
MRPRESVCMRPFGGSVGGMALRPPSAALLSDLAAALGPRGFSSDPNDMKPWLTDWRGRYQGAAAALLSPATAEEVRTIVARCASERVGLVPQGGNTSMVGGATPEADGRSLLLSTRRLNRIRSLSQDENALVAEAGVILTQVHEAAEQAGRRFPLSLGAKGSATVGGLVSTNAGGTQVLRFGPMRSLVLGIEAVLPDGSLYSGLSALRKDNRGYDLKQLLIGGEGTLGIVTAASLKLVPAPGSRAVAWVGIASPADALRLLRWLEGRLGESVEAFELVPREVLVSVLHHIPGVRAPLAELHAWNVLIELVSPGSGSEADALISEALAEALDSGLALDAMLAASEAQAQGLWRIRESIAEAERLEGPSVKHDISVPVSRLPEFMDKARAAIERGFPGTRIVAFGHLGDGNLHYNVLPPEDGDAAAWISVNGGKMTALVHDLVTSEGGSISAEHGIGQHKIGELMRTADPALLAAQAAIKKALDPAGIMNPHKLFT